MDTTPEPAYQPLAVEAGAQLPHRNPALLPPEPTVAADVTAGLATAHAQEPVIAAALAAELALAVGFKADDRVRYARRVVSDGGTLRIGDLGTVIEVRDNMEHDDVFGAVAVMVRMDRNSVDDAWNVGAFRPEELEHIGDAPGRPEWEAEADDVTAPAPVAAGTSRVVLTHPVLGRLESPVQSVDAAGAQAELLRTDLAGQGWTIEVKA